LYKQMEYTMGSKVSWSHADGIWMHQDVASKICRVSLGKNQPDKYNLYDKPMTLSYSYQCCNACARLEGKCKSFVFKSDTHECFLKSAYVPEENTEDCRSCISYDTSSNSYVFQKEAVWVRNVTWSMSTTTWTETSFGAGGQWKTWSSSDDASCRFQVGYDQPHDYDIMGPILVDAAYKCCAQCGNYEGEAN